MLALESNAPAQSVTLQRDAVPVATLHYRLRTPGGELAPSSVDLPGLDAAASVTATFEAATIVDRFYEEDGFIRVRRSWTLGRPGRWRLLFTCVADDPSLTDWVVPSVMYKENRAGQGSFPRGGIECGWSFREDRIPVPSCSLLSNDHAIVMVFTAPAEREEEISSIRTYVEGDRPAFEIAVPYEERPGSYRMKGIFFSGMARPRSQWFVARRRELPVSYTRDFFIKAAPRDGNVFRVFQDVPRQVRAGPSGTPDASPSGTVSWTEYATLKLRHLLFLLVDDDRRGIHGVQMGRGNGLIQYFFNSTAGSFLVKSLEAASVLARIGRETDVPELLTVAERIGRFFLQGQLPNGLHRDYYHFRTRRFESYALFPDDTRLPNGSNARSNGETMGGYLRLHRELAAAGRTVPEFRSIAERAAEFYLAHQLTGDQDGSFGRWWTHDGEPINTLGTNGAYIVSLLAELDPQARDDRISSALRRAAAYYGRLIDRNDYYADTLDADCVDKEAGCALLRAFLDLYERAADRDLLDRATDAASYLLSWIYTYDVPFRRTSLLGRTGFRTTGMTSVSVAHHHLDFYGMYIAYDFLRLWELGGDERWRELALPMMDACRRLIATADTPLTRGPAFVGWQPEHVHQTDWKYHHHKLRRKGHADFDTAWVTVLVLGAMFQIRDRFPQVLSFSVTPRVLGG
jgi:hypothetical protein